MDGLIISATQKDGAIKLERLFAGVVNDRVVMNSNRDLPRRNATWVKEAHALVTQESANIVIDIPPVPPLESNIFERLNKLEEINAAQSLLLSFLLAQQNTTKAVAVDRFLCGESLPPAEIGDQRYSGTVLNDLTASVEAAEKNAQTKQL